jgi:predicted RNase H-like nuclease
VGWLIASAKLNGANFIAEEPRLVSSFLELVHLWSLSTIALDAPVGDPKHAGVRRCDVAARALLGQDGPPASGRVYQDHDAVHARYDEVNAEMAPFRQRTIFECHPELAYFELNGQTPLPSSRDSQEGHETRRALMRSLSRYERIIDAELEGARPEELVDAAACLWTARRVAARGAKRIPAEPVWDERGIRVEIVY